MKAWSALRHRHGEATDLPGLIEKARHEDPEIRRRARFALADRLVGRGSWVSAAPRAVSELVVDAIYPDTPDRAGLLLLLARIAGSDAPRVLFRRLEPEEAAGKGVLEALDARSPEIEDLTRDEDPVVRAHAIRLISLAVPDATLPMGDEDPSVDATVAIARGRLGLPADLTTAHARAIHEAFDLRALDESALADALGWTPDPERFPWCEGDLDAFVRKLVAIKHDDRMLTATVFSLAVERWPEHPRVAERAQIVGAEGFPQAIEGPDELSDDQRAWLTRCLAIPLKRNALEVPGLPPRYEDARRFLRLDPPGLLERVVATPDGEKPIWLALEAEDGGETLRALPVTETERLELATLSVFQPYWIPPVDPDLLQQLAEARTPEDASTWATAFLEKLASTPHEDRAWEGRHDPAHVNVALLQLHRAGKPVPAGVMSFDDTVARVGAVLDALGPEQRSAALRAHLDDPDRADFLEGEVLAEVLPHLKTDARLVEPVLRCLAGVLAQMHQEPEAQRNVADTFAWAKALDAERTGEWFDLLSQEETERLEAAIEAAASEES